MMSQAQKGITQRAGGLISLSTGTYAAVMIYTNSIYEYIFELLPPFEQFAEIRALANLFTNATSSRIVSPGINLFFIIFQKFNMFLLRFLINFFLPPYMALVNTKSFFGPFSVKFIS
nr:unnamed protein product [Callosobruchus analis]